MEAKGVPVRSGPYGEGLGGGGGGDTGTAFDGRIISDSGKGTRWMRTRTDESLPPLIVVGGIPVPRLILGNLPFLGESYQGSATNRRYIAKFSRIENIVEILCSAVTSHGITAFAASPSTPGSPSEQYLTAVKETMRRTDREIGVIPCFRIPLVMDGRGVDDYRRWITYHAFERRTVDVSAKYINDPILQCREGWREKFSEALARICPYSRAEVERLKLDVTRVEEAVSSLGELNILCVEPGSESDFLAMVGRTDLLGEFADRLHELSRRPILVGTHHAGTTIPLLEEAGIRYAGYVTPVNPRGALMLPSQSRVIEAIQPVRDRVVAIKPLAGGRVPPQDAFEYVFSEVGVAASMVGVASLEELNEDVRGARRALHVRDERP
jgi:hypothetical protein